MVELNDIIRVDIDNATVDEAIKLSNEMGRLNNSVFNGGGNVCGFIGEIITAKFLGVNRENNYDYDLVFNDNKIDVKSKYCEDQPFPYYVASIWDGNTKQNTDIYVFVRVNYEHTFAWICGWIYKKDFYNKAKLIKKGEIEKDANNVYESKFDRWNLMISELRPMRELLEIIGKNAWFSGDFL